MSPDQLRPPKNDLAYFALTMSSLGLALAVCCGLGGVMSLIGAICGHRARGALYQSDDRRLGLATAAVVVGWIGVLLAVGVIAWVAAHVHLVHPGRWVCYFLPCDPAP